MYEVPVAYVIEGCALLCFRYCAPRVQSQDVEVIRADKSPARIERLVSKPIKSTNNRFYSQRSKKQEQVEWMYAHRDKVELATALSDPFVQAGSALLHEKEGSSKK